MINKLDMLWGSPTFLAPYWKKNSIKTDSIEKELRYSIGSRSRLQQKIKQLHRKINNADVKNKHIVVAAGATQIISGLLNILGKNKTVAWADPPHFSRFPILADLAKLDWSEEEDALLIISNPNNPDNTVTLDMNCDILDCCYNWPQYTDIIKYNHPVMVYSLSKATGHASTRIGWAILQDESLAKELTQFIEVSTGGLSIDAQIKAEQVITHQLKTDKTVFEYGKLVMDKRWKKILSLKTPFKIINKSGMFLWAKGKCPKNISGLNGSLMGSTDHYFRLNVGCSNKTFNQFVILYKKN